MKRLLNRILVIGLLLVLAGPALAHPLVDADWLAARAGKAGIVVLDARSDPAAFAAGHIPGAVFTHYGRDGWRAKRGNVVGMLPETAALEKLIGGLGIGNDDRVVIVAPGNSATDMGIATRIYWTFKVLGHDAVSVLDGGMKSYLAAGHPVSTAAATPAPKTFKANFRPEYLATKADVKQVVADGGRLIDNRPPPQFTGAGKSPVAARFGTIPGAANAPAVVMTKQGTGEFLDRQALADLYAAAGTTAEDDTVTFCNTGHWASVGWFVQSELLGKKNVRMYDGSISEWSQDTAAPMVKSAN